MKRKMAVPPSTTASTTPQRRRCERGRRHARGALLLLKTVALAVIASALLAMPVRAMKQQWRFRAEDRADFLVERFGFAPRATLKVTVSDVSFAFQDESMRRPREQIRAGLLFVHEDELWDTMAYIENGDDDAESEPAPSCLLENRTSALWVDFTDQTSWTLEKVVSEEIDFDDADEATRSAAAPRPGFVYIFFAQCTEGLQVSFNMEAEFRNPHANYLSAGDSALPSVYLLMSFAFLGMALAWVRFLRLNQKYIHNVHHMMTILVGLKTISLFAESMRYYYMTRHGDTLTSWTAVYYVFVFLKGVMLFVVILLIGTGWSLLKAHLSNRDKYIISVVLLLQVFSNTAMIVMEESSVGTRSWVTWRDVLHIMDILCCFAILFPIVWSIKSLRESAFTDGKAHINLQKLIQFRSFYLIVVSYIYVTRIALFILTASLPYYATWISVVISEAASLTFFGMTGYRFRPLDQNPYLEVSTRIDSLDEFGLDDDDLEVQGVPIQRRDHSRFNLLRPVSPRKTYRLHAQSRND